MWTCFDRLFQCCSVLSEGYLNKWVLISAFILKSGEKNKIKFHQKNIQNAQSTKLNLSN
jgi:hypothetical protein